MTSGKDDSQILACLAKWILVPFTKKKKIDELRWGIDHVFNLELSVLPGSGCMFPSSV